jgi:hypothetical protein
MFIKSGAILRKKNQGRLISTHLWSQNEKKKKQAKQIWRNPGELPLITIKTIHNVLKVWLKVTLRFMSANWYVNGSGSFGVLQLLIDNLCVLFSVKCSNIFIYQMKTLSFIIIHPTICFNIIHQQNFIPIFQVSFFPSMEVQVMGWHSLVKT